MRITLNLATRPYADQGPRLKQLRIGMAILAVIIALLAWGMHHFHDAAMKTAAQEAALDRSIAQIQHEQQGYQEQMQQPANAKVLTQAGFLNKLFDEKSFSWTATMEDLEPVLPAGVQVTAIEPVRDKNGDLTLRLRVTGLRERSVEMIRNMEHSRRFVSPRIVGENSENASSQGNLQPVSAASKVTFEILSEYSQASPDERKASLAAQKREHAAKAASAVPIAQTGPRKPYIPVAPQPAAPRVFPSRVPNAQAPGMPHMPPGPVRSQGSPMRRDPSANLNPGIPPNAIPNNPGPGGPQ